MNKNRQGHMFYTAAMIPLIIATAVLFVYPVIVAFTQSFTNASFAAPDATRFVGFHNYVRFFTDPIGRQVLGNTLKFAFTVVLGETVLGLLVALLLNKSFPGKGVVRTIMIIPAMLSPVLVGYMWRWIYHDQFGILNFILLQLGLIQVPIAWTGNISVAMPALLAAQIWYGVPFAIIIFMGGLDMLPATPYEAAIVDGASSLQSFWHITLPLLKPVTMAVVLLRSMFAFQAFDLIFILTYGGPGSATEVMNSYGYKIAFRHFQTGYASAITMVSLILLLALGIVVNLVFNGGKSK